MKFFEFSFRKRVEIENILSAIAEYFGNNISNYSYGDYYGEDNGNILKPNHRPYVIYKISYSNKGFETYFEGEAYEFDPDFNELALALFFVERFKTEVVINNFTSRTGFLLIKEDKKVYHTESDGISGSSYLNELRKKDDYPFEIDYESIFPADDIPPHT